MMKQVQLEGRTRELESLQAKLVPQDLDMIRLVVRGPEFFLRCTTF